MRQPEPERAISLAPSNKRKKKKKEINRGNPTKTKEKENERADKSFIFNVQSINSVDETKNKRRIYSSGQDCLYN